MTVATRLAPFGSTIFAEMSRLAAEHDAVNVSQGFPDFDGPPPVLEALADAARNGPHQYAPTHGLPALRDAVARWASLFGGPAVDPDAGVTVTCGCTEAIASSMLGLLEPGDELVVFEPFYDSYRAAAAMAGATVVPVPLTPGADGGFAFDPADLRAAMASRPRAILLNTPHNPTGKVFDHGELALIAALCVEHDVLAITDEVYDHLVFEGEHHRLAGMDGMAERTITMGSIGKLFSVTGWKVGWAVGPAALTRAVRSAHQFLTFAANAPAQAAAAVALDNHLHTTGPLREHLRAMRDLLCDALETTGLGVYRPASGYFALCDHTALSERLGLEGDVQLCRHLVEHVGVAAIPPSFFYADPARGAHLVRFAFCKRDATMRAAIDRLGSL